MLARPLLLCALLAAGTCSGARAATAWDESVSGDLSNVGTAPTAVTLVPGSNLVSGTTGRGSSGVDRDYFTVTVGPGLFLEALTVLPGSSFLGASGLSFIAVQAGPQVTVNPTGGSATGLLGWWHYNENDIGTDILMLMGSSPGATGYVDPLPAGVYSFWVQDTGSGSAAYRFDFQVGTVPEPASGLALLTGLGLLRWRRRRG